MAGYRALFHDKACIVATAKGWVLWEVGPDDFVRMQRGGTPRFPERMTSVEAFEDSVAAVARVRWELTGHGRTSTGIDVFTLVRDRDGSWKIVHLLFYQEP